MTVIVSKQNSRKLCLAAAKGNVENVKKLMQLGTDPNWPANDESFDYYDLDEFDDAPWEHPLFLAAWHGHLEVAKELLDANANPNLSTYSPRLARIDPAIAFTTAWVPLLAASARGRNKLVDLLLDHQADINWTTRLSNQSAFSLALKTQHWAIARVLLDRGFTFSSFPIDDQIGWYCQVIDKQFGELANAIRPLLLQNGLKKRQLEIIEFVYSASRSDIKGLERGLDQGIPVDAVCWGDMKANALFFAAWKGDVQVIKWLVNHGASVNYEAASGTVLMRAAIHGHLDAVKALVEAGADPTVSLDGLTALNLVNSIEFPEVAEYLESLSKPPKKRGLRGP